MDTINSSKVDEVVEESPSEYTIYEDNVFLTTVSAFSAHQACALSEPFVRTNEALGAYEGRDEVEVMALNPATNSFGYRTFVLSKAQ